MANNTKNYLDIDILRVLMNIGPKKARNILCQQTGLGEGSIKGILTNLKNKKILESTKHGHFFTKKGKTIKSQIDNEISGIEIVKLNFFQDFTGGVLLVKNSKKEITYKMRDIAIRSGAEAALIFRFDKKLFLPQCEQDLIDTKKLDHLFEYSNGDILVVVFANEMKTVERSLLNVAINLNSKLEKMFNQLCKN